MAKKNTNMKTKGLTIFEDDIVVFDTLQTEGIVILSDNQWYVLGEKGHKWDLQDSIDEGISIITSFNQN